MEDITSRHKRGTSQYYEEQGLDATAITECDVKNRKPQRVNLDHMEVRDAESRRLAFAPEKHDFIDPGAFYAFFAGFVAATFAQEGFTFIIAAIFAGALTAVIIIPIIDYLNVLLYHKNIFKELLVMIAMVFIFGIPFIAVIAI